MGVHAAYITLAVLAVAFLFLFISFVSPYWFDQTTQGTRRVFGLWRQCLYHKAPQNSYCEELVTTGQFHPWLAACAAMMTIAMFTLGGALACVILFLFIGKFKGVKRIILCCCILTFLTSILTFIAIVIFAAKEDFLVKMGGNAGWAYALAVTSNILVLIACGTTFIQHRKTYEY